MKVSEASLIGIISDQKQSVKNKDAAFKELVIRYKAGMKNNIRNKGKLTKEDVDDIYQDALIRIWKKLSKGGYEERGVLGAWIYKITFYTTMDFFTSKYIKAIELNHEAFSIEELSHEDVLINREEIRFYLGLLTDIQLEMFKLYLKGYSHGEIAKMTDIKSENGSKTMLTRIRNKFKINKINIFL